MAYTSLANKYRPQTFKEVVGQESISTTLMNAVKSGRISHAYLFYGPRGCGKTTTARLLAKALNCEHGPTAEPCGKCAQCKEIASSSDLDVLELDAASNTQVDKVREGIIDTVALASGRDRYKVFILDEVHMLSNSSFNALLKTLEEPPSHVVFILATTELNKVPLTITSRCQTFRFKPIAEKEISTHLLDLAEAENIELTEGAALKIAKNAGGALRDALTILDRAISFSGGCVNEDLISKMLGLLPSDLIKNASFALVKKDEPSLHKVFQTIKEEGFDSLSLLKDLKVTFGEIFYFSLGTVPAPFDGAQTLLEEASPSFIAGLTRKLSKLYDEVRFSDTQDLATEVGLFTIMQNSVDLENLISRLESLENGEETKEVDAPPTQSSSKKAKKVAPEKKEEEQATEESDTIKATEENLTTLTPTQAVSKNEKEPTFNPVEMLPSFKKNLAEHFPFLAESIQEAQISFPSAETWRFEFKDSFLEEACSRRKKDFENLAQEVFKRKITFNFISCEEVVSSPRKVDILKNITSPKTIFNKEDEGLISKEEPFSMQEFPSSEVKDTGIKTKKILEMFDAQIISK